MAQVSVEGEIAAPIDDVWKVVSDFVGFISAQGLECVGAGDGIGMVRTISIGSIEIVERLEALDETKHRTSYSIVSGPIPVKDYLASIELIPAGESATKVTWTGTFEPEGVSDEQATQMMDGTYKSGIKALQKHFAG